MSMHNKPLTDEERNGLRLHGLKMDKPSQLSDCFRLGMEYQKNLLEAERDALKAEIEHLKNPWISVEDRLPLKSGEIKQVMVLATDGIDVEQCQFDAGTNWAEWNLYNNMESSHIKKWMPLPKLEGKGDE